jgi:hypothetical protein
MKCPHCGVHFHDNWMMSDIARGQNTGWYYRTALCPACRQITIELCPPLERATRIRISELPLGARNKEIEGLGEWRQVHPIGSNRGPVPPEVPEPIAGDYVEACRVLPISAKASAALSRRCLQAMLHAHEYKGKDLAKEVQQLLDEKDPAKVLPRPIHQTVDVIRHFGNFSAHPINDITSLQVIDVEPHEAEWCLDIIEALFEHFYVGPAAADAKKAALNAKLEAAGKPPLK